MTARPLPVDRRTALLVGASALLAAVAGCAEEQPDPKAERLLAALRDQAGRAWRESEQAALIADRDLDLAVALREVGDARRRHAEALDTQLARLAPPQTTTASSSPKPPAAGSLDELKASLAESQRLAGELVGEFSGYPAGLAASIAAAIRVLLAITLAEEG